MIRLLFKLSLFSPILLAMGGINWAVDPASLFGQRVSDPSQPCYEDSIVADLLAGRRHRVQAPFSERLVHELMLVNRPNAQTLAFGSSVAMPIHQAALPGTTFYNCALSGARLDEIVAVHQMTRECGVRPNRIVLQLSAWTLERRRWRVPTDLVSVYQRAILRLNAGEHDVDPPTPFWKLLFGQAVEPPVPNQFFREDGLLHPYDHLASPRYLQFCLKYLERSAGRTGGGQVAPVYRPEDQQTLFPDGSREWSERKLERPRAQPGGRDVEFDASTAADEQTRPTYEEQTFFETFVRNLIESGVRVDLLLTPPNPAVDRVARARYERRAERYPPAETESYLRAFAAEHRLRVIGSFDPIRAGLTGEDFVDNVHLRREAIARLLEAPSPTATRTAGESGGLETGGAGN